MSARLDDLADLIVAEGHDPRAITLEEIFGLIQAEARGRAGRAMAAIMLNKEPHLVTPEEARAALTDWVTIGDEPLTGKTMRAGESAFITALRERGLYDVTFASLRHTTNRDLDLGEVTVMGKRWPTNKRPSGRPGSRERFAKMVTVLVKFTIGSGEARSVERAVALLTGRDRDGKAVGDGPLRLALPNGKKSHWVVHEMLRWAAVNVPDLNADALRQGEIAKAGGVLDPKFSVEFRDICAILADRTKVDKMLRATRRKNRPKPPEKSSQTRLKNVSIRSAG